MNTETIPAPTFFEKLLGIPGGPWYMKFLTHVAMPIRYRFFGPRDPARFIAQLQAEGVRGACREMGIEASPRMLNEPEACPTCDESVLMLVQPHNVCFDCFGGQSVVLDAAQSSGRGK
jgi:hypothetical protein